MRAEAVLVPVFCGGVVLVCGYGAGWVLGVTVGLFLLMCLGEPQSP